MDKNDVDVAEPVVGVLTADWVASLERTIWVAMSPVKSRRGAFIEPSEASLYACFSTANEFANALNALSSCGVVARRSLMSLAAYII